MIIESKNINFKCKKLASKKIIVIKINIDSKYIFS